MSILSLIYLKKSSNSWNSFMTEHWRLLFYQALFSVIFPRNVLHKYYISQWLTDERTD